eukprot:TRINITY_DN23975_c0_g3_i1.p1 TRINITY_DN23975_c0_g3~~TRINITY_DN23975_c0_g3_i1.p1  ORF type:complete len:435 (-),score=56.38 TRINITY_DN23975_c0_g3_i1:125-1429(-)
MANLGMLMWCTCAMLNFIGEAEMTLVADDLLTRENGRVQRHGEIRDAADGVEERRREGDLSVAIAVIVPYGVVNHDPQWQDGFAVFAQSARTAMARSKRCRKVDYLAFVPEDVAVDDAGRMQERDALARLGLTAIFVPIPVRLEEVGTAEGREILSKVLGEKEQLKYYGAAMTEYDRVLVADADVILLHPFDELFDLSPKAGMVGTYDHEMDIRDSVFPPVNSGFLLFTPDKADFDGLVEVYREGNLTGRGFRYSGTGYTYGAGSQGMLSFFYNQWIPGYPGVNFTVRPVKGQDLPGMPATVQPPGSRFYPVDRSIYGVILTDSLKWALSAGHASVDKVKAFHFAGGCLKPWTCSPTNTDLCNAMTDRWWDMRHEVESAHGLPRTERCQEWHAYQPMFMLNATDLNSDGVAASVLQPRTAILLSGSGMRKLRGH